MYRCHTPCTGSFSQGFNHLESMISGQGFRDSVSMPYTTHRFIQLGIQSIRVRDLGIMYRCHTPCIGSFSQGFNHLGFRIQGQGFRDSVSMPYTIHMFNRLIPFGIQSIRVQDLGLGVQDSVSMPCTTHRFIQLGIQSMRVQDLGLGVQGLSIDAIHHATAHSGRDAIIQGL